LTYNKKVINLPLSEVWTFYDFRYVNGTNPIEDWYKRSLSDGARFVFDALLKNIHRIKNHLEWGCFRGFLKGRLKEQRIWELGFQSDGRQYRLLCVFGEKRKQVILLVGCYHKQKVYVPPDALSTAYTRSKALSEGKAGYYERKIRTDQ